MIAHYHSSLYNNPVFPCLRLTYQPRQVKHVYRIAFTL